MLSHLPHVTTFLTLFLKTMQALIELQQSQAVRINEWLFLLGYSLFSQSFEFFRFVELP